MGVALGEDEVGVVQEPVHAGHGEVGGHGSSKLAGCRLLEIASERRS